jgi:hypothetical protein
MSCQTGIQYIYDPTLSSYLCSGEHFNPVKLVTVNSGQIITFKSGVSAWLNSGENIYQLGPSGLSWVLETGANLYSYNLGLKPFQFDFVDGSGLPPGLTLTGYNKIVGTPTQTGIFNCATEYVYCTEKPFTGVAKIFTVIVCTGIDSGQAYTPNFIPALGSKFYYDNFKTGLVCDGVEYDEIRSALSGQRLILELNRPAWKFTSEDYNFVINDDNFLLESNSNLFVNSNGLVPTGFTHTDLPPNLYFDKYNLIAGTPTITGLWSIELTQIYCDSPDFFRTVRFSIQVLDQSSLIPVEGILFVNYPSINTIPYIERKIKNVDFYYRQENRFYRYFDSVTGYGNVNANISGQNILSFGNILNPTGWRDALVYQTGQLTGFINPGNNSFTWFNQSIEGCKDSEANVFIDNRILFLTGINDERPSYSDDTYIVYWSDGSNNWLYEEIGVQTLGLSLSNVLYPWLGDWIGSQQPQKHCLTYIDEITGTRQAQNIIYFNTGLLTEGDILNINGYDFIYSLGTQSDFIFDSPGQLAIKLNSGASNSTSPVNPVGVTGFVNSDNLYLYSYLLQGESGNSIRVYRNSTILEAITIPNRYFVSGETFRPVTNTSKGSFVSLFPSITAENSGNYTLNYLDAEKFDNISGVVWVDTFSGNYFVRTGIKTPDNITTYSGRLLNYIPSKNIYSGASIIPSGQKRIPSGFNIDILKPNYYNISGNFAKYTISGIDFLYTGIIEG